MKSLILKYKQFLSERSKLDIFLLKGFILACTYFVLRILFRGVEAFNAVFQWSKHLMINFYLKTSQFLIDNLGYETLSYNNVLKIADSNGIKVVNACIGWSIMALFIGFIIAYPGTKKSKFRIIPLGLAAIILANILRITLMAVISYESPDSLQFYHRYIFNFILYLVVFAAWICWIRSNNKNELAQ
ncbi:MAG: archaeosortase/exosortase family protein [Bacteroidales bacterium]|nr:archaeosortase/exosortase family protein [Bacteroidales bacterium]MBN2819826.1 archaeosortase/exosortase family protein [Bacteroidales bacterium]